MQSRPKICPAIMLGAHLALLVSFIVIMSIYLSYVLFHTTTKDKTVAKTRTRVFTE